MYYSSQFSVQGRKWIVLFVLPVEERVTALDEERVTALVEGRVTGLVERVTALVEESYSPC